MINLNDIVREFNIELTNDQLEQFDRFYELLIQWNEKVNLTAITEHDEVMIKHFADSLSICRSIDMSNIHSVIDVGTGGGFPGIPLAIVYDDIEFTLLDSLNKRINFLNTVVEELGLNNVTTIHGRAEDYAREVYRESYDLCVSRAVANLSTLSELCIPFIRVGGYFVSYKSEKASEEIDSAGRAINILGCKLDKVDHFIIPTTDYERNMVVINKLKSTPNKYPRKAGTPGRQPL